MIREFFELVKTQLPNDLEFELGDEHIFEHSSPPRVVVVPRRGRFIEPDQSFGQETDTIVAVRQLSLWFYCWGENLEDADCLVQMMYARIKRVATIQDALEEWEESSQLVQNGVNVGLQITVATGVKDIDDDTITVLADVMTRLKDQPLEVL